MEDSSEPRWCGAGEFFYAAFSAFKFLFGGWGARGISHSSFCALLDPCSSHVIPRYVSAGKILLDSCASPERERTFLSS